MVLFILIALIPTAIIGFAFKDLFESFFYNLTAVGIAFLATGCFLFVCDRWPGKGNIRFRSSLLMGFAQGIAIIPGISRSGATIGTGLLAGIDKEKVARFSFILAVPAILGASVFDFNAVDISSIGWDASLAGIAVSAVAGYASIKFLLGVIKKQKFRWFAVYCWLIGVVTLLLF
jgi:undecaprenyl-diphosphatase